jgi:hypothetical protein
MASDHAQPLTEGAALMLAAERGAIHSIRAWQRRGGDLNAPLDHAGSIMTPLQTAAHAGLVLAVRSLLECGADVDRTPSEGLGHVDYRPLLLAARAGHTAVLLALLEAGANPLGADAFGQSALHYAAAFGHADCSMELLRYGADPTARDATGHRPDSLASSAGHMHLSGKVLVEKNCASLPPNTVPYKHAPQATLKLISCVSCVLTRQRYYKAQGRTSSPEAHIRHLRQASQSSAHHELRVLRPLPQRSRSLSTPLSSMSQLRNNYRSQPRCRFLILLMLTAQRLQLLPALRSPLLTVERACPRGCERSTCSSFSPASSLPVSTTSTLLLR